VTKAHDTALRRLITLKSRPEVAGYVEMSQAEALETDGKLMDAIRIYESVAANPRYENTVPALKARRKLDDLNKNEATKAKIKTENDAKADKEAPMLLARARDFVSNNMPKQAMEKLEQVVAKFPNSKYAEEAKKMLADLK
jgi:TolA-binding protein